MGGFIFVIPNLLLMYAPVNYKLSILFCMVFSLMNGQVDTPPTTGLNATSQGTWNMVSSQFSNVELSSNRFGPIQVMDYVYQHNMNSLVNEFDTQINSDAYNVMLQGYQFVPKISSGNEKSKQIKVSDRNIELYQNPVSKTWVIRSIANKPHIVGDSSKEMNSNLSFYVSVIICEKGFTSSVEKDLKSPCSEIRTAALVVDRF